jgi:hypothetical protein
MIALLPIRIAHRKSRKRYGLSRLSSAKHRKKIFCAVRFLMLTAYAKWQKYGCKSARLCPIDFWDMENFIEKRHFYRLSSGSGEASSRKTGSWARKGSQY